MKIGVFAYNFEHKKTQEGLLQLFLNGYRISCVLAADPVKLTFYQSKIRVSPKGLTYNHPEKIAKMLNIPYKVVTHNSSDCIKIIKDLKLDLGIILGARILKEDVIRAFKIGVLNMHPGLLPENRGLDTIKWAIIKGFKQGVTTHLITKQIDRGYMILKNDIMVYNDDTLLDIFLRIQNKELNLMIESLKVLELGEKDFELIGDGNYFKSVPPELETILLKRFKSYKKTYNNLKYV